ncbi:MAG: hypothetical protein ACTHNY_12325, partial [Solirubrobacterales bacterium]
SLYAATPRRRLARHALSRQLELRARETALLAAAAPPLARRLVPQDRPAEERLSANGGRG